MTKSLARLMMMHDQRFISNSSSSSPSSSIDNNHGQNHNAKSNNDNNDSCDAKDATTTTTTTTAHHHDHNVSNTINSQLKGLCNDRKVSTSHPIFDQLPTFQNEMSIKQSTSDTSSNDMKNISSTEVLRENSNIIQIHSSDSSIWRGSVWSKVKFNTKLDKYFLPSNQGDVSSSSSNYILEAFIECQNHHNGSIRLLNPSTCIGMKIEFKRNGVPNSSRATIDTNPYNSIELSIHQDFFNHGENFHLIVKALKLKRYDPFDSLVEPTYFGNSQNIM